MFTDYIHSTHVYFRVKFLGVGKFTKKCRDMFQLCVLSYRAIENNLLYWSFKTYYPGLGMHISLLGACLACTMPWLQSPAPGKLGMVAHTCNLSIQETKAGGSEALGHPQQHSEFEASMGRRKLSLGVIFLLLISIIHHNICCVYYPFPYI